MVQMESWLLCELLFPSAAHLSSAHSIPLGTEGGFLEMSCGFLKTCSPLGRCMSVLGLL